MRIRVLFKCPQVCGYVYYISVRRYADECPQVCGHVSAAAETRDMV